MYEKQKAEKKEKKNSLKDKQTKKIQKNHETLHST